VERAADEDGRAEGREGHAQKPIQVRNKKIHGHLFCVLVGANVK
jgi:hypothetical protein